MEKNSLINDNEKWAAVQNCSIEYDDLFLYGVTSTGIFCRPSCRAKTPDRKNVIFFSNAEQALAQGFRPCKKCRPDINVYQPDIELVQEVITALATDEEPDITKIACQLGISPSHLARLFKQHTKTTFTAYIAAQKICNAKELLKQTNMSCTEIAFSAGFNSLSAFYSAFKRHTGSSPGRYRKTPEN